MRLKNLRLSISNVARTSNARTLAVNSVGEIHAADRSNEIIGFSITCSVYRGDELRIKLPLTVQEKWEQLKIALESDINIEISFTALKLTAYALKTETGNIISGVSAKADDFEIVSTSADDLEIDL